MAAALLEILQGTTPGSASTGRTGIWPDAANRLWLVNSAGTLFELAGSVIAQYSTAAAQSIADSTITIIDYGSALVATQAGLVTTGAAWAFTAPTAGNYLIAASIRFAASVTWAAGEVAELSIYKNGAASFILDYKDAQLAASTAVQLAGAGLVNMAAGDTLNIRARQTSGGALALVADEKPNVVSIMKV